MQILIFTWFPGTVNLWILKNTEHVKKKYQKLFVILFAINLIYFINLIDPSNHENHVIHEELWIVMQEIHVDMEHFNNHSGMFPQIITTSHSTKIDFSDQ